MPNSVPLSDVTTERQRELDQITEMRQARSIACLDSLSCSHGSTLARALQTLRNQTIARNSVPAYRCTGVRQYLIRSANKSFRPQFDTPASPVHDCDLSRVAFRALKSPSFLPGGPCSDQPATVPWKRIASHLHTACCFRRRPITRCCLAEVSRPMITDNIDLMREVADSSRRVLHGQRNEMPESVSRQYICALLNALLEPQRYVRLVAPWAHSSVPPLVVSCTV
jgi:hypothetical protein